MGLWAGLGLLGTPPAAAQSVGAGAAAEDSIKTVQEGPITDLWVEAGVGLKADRTSITGMITLRRHDHLFTLRRTYSSTASRDEPHARSGYGPGSSSSDLGLLYGRSLPSPDWLLVSGSTGLALTRTTTSTNLGPGDGFFAFDRYATSTSYTLGVPLNLRLSARAPVVGLSLNVFANVNLDRSFGGVALHLQMGKLY